MTTVFFLSIFVIISCLDKELPLPWDSYIEFENIKEYESGENVSAVLDKYGSRMMIIKDNEITRIETIPIRDNHDFIDVTVAGDNVYVLENYCIDNGYFSEKGIIVKYDSSGYGQKIIYTHDHKNEKNVAVFPHISSLYNANGKVWYSEYSPDDGYIQVYCVEDDELKLVEKFHEIENFPSCCYYQEESNSIFYLDDYGRIWQQFSNGTKKLINENTVSNIFSLCDGIICYDNTAKKCMVAKKPDGSQKEFGVSDLRALRSYNSNFYIYSEKASGIDVCYQGDFEPSETITGFNADTFLITLSWLWLAAVAYALIAIAWLIAKNTSQKKIFFCIKKIFIPVGLVIVLIFFYQQDFQRQKDMIAHQINIQAVNIANNPELKLGELIGEIDELKNSREDYINVFADSHGLETSEKYRKIREYFEQYTIRTADSEVPIGVQICAYDEYGKLYFISDSVGYYRPFVYLPNNSEDILRNITTSQNSTFNNYDGFFLASSAPLKNNNDEITGYIVLESNIIFLDIHQSMFWSYLIISVILAFIVASLIMEESEFIKNALDKVKALKAKKAKYFETVMPRPFALLRLSVVYLDLYLLIFVSRDIAAANDMNINNILLINMPLNASLAAYFISTLIYPYLIKRIYSRTLMLGFAGGLILSCLACFEAVEAKYFGLFIVLKFFSSLFIGLLENISRTIPILRNSEFEKGSFGSSAVAANIIGIIFGATIAEQFGNSYIYLFMLIPATILLILGYLSMAPNNYYGDESENGLNMNSIKETFTTSHTAMMAFFALIPIVLAMCYGPVIFPVLASEWEYDMIDVNSAIIIIGFLVIFFKPYIFSLKEYADFRTLLIMCLLAMGIAYGCLLTAPHFIGLVGILLLVEIINLLAIPTIRVVWHRMTELKGFSELQIVTSYNIITKGITAFSAPIIMLLMKLDGNTKFIIMSLFCIISALVFTLLTRNTAFSLPKKFT